MMWIDGGILYTDRERKAVNVAKTKPAHKAPEWKADWWLGARVQRGPQTWRVMAAEPHGAVMMLVLKNEGGHVEKVSLVVANAALRKGDWSLL